MQTPSAAVLRRLLIPLTVLALLACAPGAAATPGPRYASPTGTSAQDCSTPGTACDIATAIDGHGANNPVAGQEVIIEPGTYTLGATLAPTVNTDIHGATGQPRPVIVASGFPALYPSGAFNLHVSDVEIDVNVPGNDGINTSGATFDRVVIRGVSNGGNLCQCYDGTMRNSVIVNTGATGGAWGVNSNGGTGNEILRNDTFIATQAGASAMFVQQEQASPTGPFNIDAKNVIARNSAGGHDVYAYGAQVTIAMTYSDYASPSQASTGVVMDGGHNISAAPAFVDQAGGDFRELVTSPTVDAGTDDTVNDGNLDFAGGPRIAGGRTDIGAFEYQPPAVVAAAGGTPQSAVVGTAFAQPLSVKVADAQGNPVLGVTVTFTAPAGSSATFAGATTVQASTGADGVASSPPVLAGHQAGGYSVTASAAGVATVASLPLTNLPGPAASLSLAPSARTVRAGIAQSYSVEAFDSYGNDVGPAGAGVRLTIAPNGSCAGLRCSALVPGAHVVTAALGGVTATAKLSVTSVVPKLALMAKSVSVARRSLRARFGVRCGAPAGEVCSITGTVTIRIHKRRLKLATVSGRVRSGARGTVSLVLAGRTARRVRGRTLHTAAVLTVVDVSGRARVPVKLTVKVR